MVLPDDLREAVENAAKADVKTVDELTTAALQEMLAQRLLDKFKRRGELNAQGKSEEEIEGMVENAVTESRIKTHATVQAGDSPSR